MPSSTSSPCQWKRVEGESRDTRGSTSLYFWLSYAMAFQFSSTAGAPWVVLLIYGMKTSSYHLL